jgi:fermentation-respiration switch protein FrsA (DUF1100 family)
MEVPPRERGLKGPHRPAAEIALLLVVGLVLLYGGFSAYMFFRQESYVFLKIRYDSLDRIGGLSCPVMVLHSRDHEIVPYEMGRRLYERAPGPKVFQVLKGGHNDGGILASPESQEVLRRFLETHLSAPLAAP